ncbi:MAG: DUF1761 domain-containing protein [Oligoflexia bacterium]|nr:DUF1761 domain-containing protein [Oligoflexia bacterium]
MTQPNIILNWPAIALAIILSYILGALWFGPLFGKQWAECMGIKFGPENKPAARAMSVRFSSICRNYFYRLCFSLYY